MTPAAFPRARTGRAPFHMTPLTRSAPFRAGGERWLSGSRGLVGARIEVIV